MVAREDGLDPQGYRGQGYRGRIFDIRANCKIPALVLCSFCYQGTFAMFFSKIIAFSTKQSFRTPPNRLFSPMLGYFCNWLIRHLKIVSSECLLPNAGETDYFITTEHTDFHGNKQAVTQSHNGHQGGVSFVVFVPSCEEN